MPIPAQPSQTFSQRLDYLFVSSRQPNGKKWNPNAVATAVRLIGQPVTGTYLGHLRKGERTNPRLALVQALAEVFGVPVGYFVDDSAAEVVAALGDPAKAPQLIELRRLVDVGSRLDADGLRRVMTVADHIEPGTPNKAR